MSYVGALDDIASGKFDEVEPDESKKDIVDMYGALAGKRLSHCACPVVILWSALPW